MKTLGQQVFQAVSEMRDPVTASELAYILQWRENKVYHHLLRLYKKGRLRRSKKDGLYHYSARQKQGDHDQPRLYSCALCQRLLRPGAVEEERPTGPKGQLETWRYCNPCWRWMVRERSRPHEIHSQSGSTLGWFEGA